MSEVWVNIYIYYRITNVRLTAYAISQRQEKVLIYINLSFPHQPLSTILMSTTVLYNNGHSHFDHHVECHPS